MSKKILTTDEAEQQMTSQQSQQVSARNIKASPAPSMSKNKLLPSAYDNEMQVLEQSSPNLKYGNFETSNQAHSAEPILSSRGNYHQRNIKNNATNETDREIPKLLNMKEKIQEELRK